MSAYTPPTFKSIFLPHPLSPSSRVHVLESDSSDIADQNKNKNKPIVFCHGLGSASSYWLPLLWTSDGTAILKDRKVFALDLYGHGISDFVREEDGLDKAAESVGMIIEELLKKTGHGRVVLCGHSLSGVVTSLVAGKRHDIVERLFLLSPTLSPTQTVRDNLLARATLILTPDGPGQVASTVSTTGISSETHQVNPFAAPMIRLLVLGTKTSAYANACKMLASHPGWDVIKTKIECQVLILGGERDYMVSPEVARKQANELVKGQIVEMEKVGHWGALEAPERVAKELRAFLGA